MDGVHIEGGCRNGFLQNLKGACHDDMVVITADDSLYGEIENITVEHVAASACLGTPDVSGGRFPFLWVEVGLDVKGLKLSDILREEKTHPAPTLKIDAEAHAEDLMISNVHQINHLDTALPFWVLEGKIQGLFTKK